MSLPWRRRDVEELANFGGLEYHDTNITVLLRGQVDGDHCHGRSEVTVALAVGARVSLLS